MATPDHNSPSPVRLDRSTVISVGAAATVVAMLLGGFGWVDARSTARADALSLQLHDIQRRVDRIELQSELRDGDRWSVRAMTSWAARFQAGNPTLAVPEVQ